MKDELGKRIKSNYENRYNFKLPRRTYVYCRLDGQAFHTYTKGLKKPFDFELIDDLIKTCEYLCDYVSGVKFGYVQSDEISLLITDFDTIKTSAFFDFEIQKLCSILASHATVKFNQLRWQRGYTDSNATFDCRVMSISDPIEVINTFYWRQKDIERNSLSMLAQYYFSQKTLHKKNRNDLHELLHTKGVNWNNIPGICKRGALIEKNDILKKWIGDAAPNLRQYLPKILPRFEWFE